MTSGPRTTSTTGLPPVPESMLPREHVGYRPRHSDRQRVAKVVATVFFAVPLLLFVVGVRPPEFENRPLRAFPSITDGWGFFTGMEGWANDNLPLRDAAVRAVDGVSRGVFGEPPQFPGRRDTGPVQPPAQPGPGDIDRDKLRASGFPKVIEGRDGWLYLGYDVLGACLPERPMDDVVNAVKDLRSAVESSGRKLVFVVAPDKSTMVPENMPAEYVGKTCAKDARDEFWRRVVGEGGALDLRPALTTAGERRGTPVYSRVDTHWTHEGGLVMTRALAEAVQPGVTAAWKATPAAVVQRAGDLPPLLGQSANFPLQTYDLAPDGVTVQSRAIDKAFRDPLRLTGAGGRGVVAREVGMVADSFTLFATQYLSGGFADLTVVHSDTAGTDPTGVARMLAEHDIVVVEAAERSLVSGINPVLSRTTIDAIKTELAKKPRR
ncbi:hypothetical protein AB0A74_11955 [Saccharothrix sp. NPDC042600]|uniref:alginate O-acetyltransferase AlgX-related protein n=1 Tax=Saccharothrix TaxID=2071 RepID=UPI0033F12015